MFLRTASPGWDPARGSLGVRNRLHLVAGRGSSKYRRPRGAAANRAELAQQIGALISMWSYLPLLVTVARAQRAYTPARKSISQRTALRDGL